MYDIAKPEHVTGKTIRKAEIDGNMVDLTFTDGTSLLVSLTYVGYTGARLDNTFWDSLHGDTADQ